MASYEKFELTPMELEQAATYMQASVTGKLARAVLGRKPSKSELAIARRQNMTMFGRVHEDAARLLANSHEIETILIEHDLPEDITTKELERTSRLLPRRTTITANSLAFDDPNHLAPIYGLLRAAHGGEPIPDLNAYRYIAVEHEKPLPYGLERELYVVGLQTRREGRSNRALARVSIEPVFLDVIDSLGDIAQFSRRDELAHIVNEDMVATFETYNALHQELGHS